MKEFSNEDLKAGMLVELKNRAKGILIPVGGRLEVFRINDLEPLTDAIIYDESLESLNKQYSIVKVYGLSSDYTLFEESYRDLLWEYKEPAKKMTIAEIEAELGYKIKIVDNKER